MKRILSSSHYANVVATLALIVALSGSAYAAATITGKDVKDHSLTGKDIKKESLGSKQIKGLKAKDFKGGLPAGRTGPQGQPGQRGPAGADGSALAYAHVEVDGTITPDMSKNLVAVDAKTFAVRCFDYTGGTVKNAVATVDFGGADTRKGRVAVALKPADVDGACNAGADIAVGMAAAGDTGTFGEVPFYLAVIG